MKVFPSSTPLIALAAMMALPLSSVVSAQAQDAVTADSDILVQGELPSDLTGLPKGPRIEGVISARKGERIQVSGVDGANTEVSVGEVTRITSSGGFLGTNRDRLTANQLLNGLPVTVETVQYGGGLVASKIALKSRDYRVASMIRSGTAQGFAEQTAATEALRGRVADIDQYNVKGTTNVNFDTGKWNLSEQAKVDLCQAAQQANGSENALLLVVGYTDSTGSEEINQELSEKRASRVVNYLQQACGWKPYRMLTPTGMAAADPAADNSTEAGKAQNRRVAVNILVSKAVDQM
ncbi:MAG: OmpA family protein [Altererythrobacter sp.]|nr:OmpA family protein [Altererythrobacter sp.]